MMLVADGLEISTILWERADGLTHIIVRSSRDECESEFVSELGEAYEGELLVLERWARFHRRRLGFDPWWRSHDC